MCRGAIAIASKAAVAERLASPFAMNASSPVVSVVTVARNAAAYIDACAESVLAQAGPALSWVALDNGSTDGTREKLEGWAKRDPRVVLITANENLGIVGGLLRALPEVTGRFVAFLDGDDVALPERLRRSVEWLEGGTERLAVYGEAEFIDERDRPLAPWFLARDDEALRSISEFVMPAIHSTGMVRSTWLRDMAAEIPHTQVNDYFLLGRALESGKVGWLSQPLSRYRVHAASASQRRPVVQLAQGIATSVLAAQRRTGRTQTGTELYTWAERTGQVPSAAAVHAAAAQLALDHQLPRLALFHARRAVRQGKWSALPSALHALWQGRSGRERLWPILRGGLLSAAQVDGRGHSVRRR
jgi:hypothetical protein